MINKINVSVLIPLTWDDNKWECGEEFIRSHPHYELLKDYFQAQEKIIFGHKKYPLEGKFPIDALPPSEVPPDMSGIEGTYVGYSRMIRQILPFDNYFYANAYDFTSIVFVSTKTETFIVGFYLFPAISYSHNRLAKHKIYKSFTFGNIRSKGEDIVRLENYLPIDNTSIHKELKEKNYAYIENNGLLTILDEVIKLNPEQKDLKSVVSRFKKTLS